MNRAKHLLATIAVLSGCQRSEFAGDRSASTDTSLSAAPAKLASQSHSCPDSLRRADSLVFQQAWAFQSRPGVEPEQFCFVLADGVYEIASSGAGRRVGPQGPQSFQLEWQDVAVFAIERLLVRTYEGDVMLALEISDGESGASELLRLDRQTLRQRWHARIPGFNLGPPLVADSVAYVGAMGFVGRVDLQRGEYDWQARDLYDHQTGHFNSVDSISLKGDTVAFAAAGAGHPPRILLFHRESGALLGRREGALQPQ